MSTLEHIEYVVHVMAVQCVSKSKTPLEPSDRRVSLGAVSRLFVYKSGRVFNASLLTFLPATPKYCDKHRHSFVINSFSVVITIIGIHTLDPYIYSVHPFPTHSFTPQPYLECSVLLYCSPLHLWSSGPRPILRLRAGMVLDSCKPYPIRLRRRSGPRC
jgi:hypothetical protein